MFRPGQGHGFLRAMKICSMPFFRGEVKLEALCRNFYDMLNNNLAYIVCHLNSKTFLANPHFTTICLCCKQRTLVDELG
jgi:hypothetical protein